MIHSHAVVDKEATVGTDTEIGAFTIVGRGARIGKGCKIGHHVVIHPESEVGDNVRIDDHAVVGKFPMKAANSATTKEQALPAAQVLEGCIVGTGAILYRGSKVGPRALVADLAAVRENVTVGEKSIVGWGALIENECTVGNFVKVEAGAYITAYSTIEDRCFIAPGVVTSNDNFVGRTEERFKHFKGVTVKRGGRIGAGATILPGKVIEAEGLVAAGSVVSKNVPAGQIVLGTPARKLRDVPPEQYVDAQPKK